MPHLPLTHPCELKYLDVNQNKNVQGCEKASVIQANSLYNFRGVMVQCSKNVK